MQSKQYDSTRMTVARAWLGCALVSLVGAAVAAPLFWRQQTALGTAGAALSVLGALLVLVTAGHHAPHAGLSFEYDVRRRFRAVCQQKGLTVKRPAGEPVYPLAGRLTGNRQGFSLALRPLAGQSPADFERAAPAFALAYGVTGVRFRNNGDGTLTMQAGYQRLDAHDFTPHPVAAAVSELPIRERLRRVQLGAAEGGRPFLLPLIDSHTLIAGITGAGKGSVIWSLLLRLAPEIEAGTVRAWGLDPKHMELSVGRAFFDDRYAADPDAMVVLLERAHDEMQARAAGLAGQVRRFEPSPGHPLNVVVIDELGYLAGLPDRKLRDRADRALTGMLMLGRAVGFSVIGALQDPRKEVLGYRDLFPTRVAMRLPKPMVDLVLGTGMYEAGAQCDLIPSGPSGAGVAFVLDEGSTLPLCVRMSWCSDELIRATAARLLPGGAAVPHLRAAT